MKFVKFEDIDGTSHIIPLDQVRVKICNNECTICDIKTNLTYDDIDRMLAPTTLYHRELPSW